MNISFPIRSTFLFTLWFAIISIIISVFIFIFFSSGWIVWGLTGILVFLSFFVFGLRLKKCKLFYSTDEIRIQRGLLWRSSQRIPCKYITGVTVIRTPLHILFSVSSLLIFTSGTLMLILGMSRDDADRLTPLLLNKGEFK